MKIDINGIVREMTEKEIEEMERQNAEINGLEMTTEERIKQIEAELIELAGIFPFDIHWPESPASHAVKRDNPQ